MTHNSPEHVDQVWLKTGNEAVYAACPKHGWYFVGTMPSFSNPYGMSGKAKECPRCIEEQKLIVKPGGQDE